MSSEYMIWVKTQARTCQYNLASSGLANYPLANLPVKLDDLELTGPSYYGYEPLQQAIAQKCNVSPDQVFAAIGTSLANHIAMAVLLQPDDEILIEHPTYELLISTASYLGATIKRFNRKFEDGFQTDLREIERVISPKTRLIVLTNLHNPSSALTDETTLKHIGEIGRSVGARVLVDEVYLDAAFDLAPRSSIHLGKEFIVTSSLTKVYGLSGLRCGWVLAEPELIGKMWHLNDLFGNIPAHSAERLSVIAFDNLETIAKHASLLLKTNHTVIDGFLASYIDLEAKKSNFGTLAFPRLKNGNSEELCRLLMNKYDTVVVPGKFFEMPGYFRIGFGCKTETLKEGLERLGMALQELRTS